MLDVSVGDRIGSRKVIWAPFEGMQELALTCPANEILLEGTRGPGKSEIQLALFRKEVGQGYGTHWRGVIFDRAYKNLDDLVSKSRRLFGAFNDGARFLSGKSDYRWVWPTGEELLFRQLKTREEYSNYHGQEFPFIGWNELTKYPDPGLYDDMISCNRASFIADPESGIPPIPLRIVATTNPLGPGHNWVKHRFIDPAPPGALQEKWTKVFNPRTQREEMTKRTICRLFCSYKENRALAPEYIAYLESIQDENKRRAWLLGDWDITSGGALDDVWSAANIVPRFSIPESWHIDRSFDWGSTHPFSVGWWAEANGEEIELPDGKKWAPVKGSLFRIYELYGAKDLDEGINTGLQASPSQIADEIIHIEDMLRERGYVNGHFLPGPADNQIRNVIVKDTPTIETLFNQRGIYWDVSDKSKGSRKVGLELVRQMVANAKTGEDPALYVFSNCSAFLKTVPILPRDDDDPDDVDTTSADHIYDETRYRVLSSTYRPGTLEVSYPR